MKINRNNYEEYAIDFLEGNLPENVRLEFESFLSKNPDIASEFEGLDQAVLQTGMMEPAPRFDKKSELYRDTALVALLHQPLRLKVWHVAAAFLVLISGAWIAISHHMDSPNQLQIAANELQGESTSTSFPENLAFSKARDAGSEEVLTQSDQSSSIPTDIESQAKETTGEVKAETPLVEKRDDNPVVAESGEPASSEQIGSEREDSYAEKPQFIAADIEEIPLTNKSDSELATKQNLQPVQPLPGRELWSESILPQREEPIAKNLDLPQTDNLHDHIQEGRQQEGGLLTRLVERVVPDRLNDLVDPDKIQLNSDRIPTAFLPEYIQQKSL